MAPGWPQKVFLEEAELIRSGSKALIWGSQTQLPGRCLKDWTWVRSSTDSSAHTSFNDV